MAPSPNDGGLLAGENALADLMAWRRVGRACALVTLVGIDGATPRPIGAQMAVTEDGTYSGYLSGGCLEKAVAEEAMAALRAGENRIVRYGKGSKYFDIRLPCGGALDLYIDGSLERSLLDTAFEKHLAREPFCITTDTGTGKSALVGDRTCGLEKGKFSRLYLPAPRVVLAGAGPALSAITRLMTTAGFELEVFSPDDDARRHIGAMGVSAHGLTRADGFESSNLDAWTAVVAAFHEHDWEAPILAHALRSSCFYIGALGSKAAHANRIKQLRQRGLSDHDLSRLRSPIGLIAGAKSRVTLAIGIVGDVAAEAKAAGILA